MKTQTYLPLFSGFYNTIWETENQESDEIHNINVERDTKGWEPISWDNCKFDYADYQNKVCKGVTAYVERELKQFVNPIEFESLQSPREYNFRNDSINVTIDYNKETIEAYLLANREAFATYLKESYTSREGFISSYPNNIGEFMTDQPLDHAHKLGSILQFICNNEGLDEFNAYDNVEAYLSCINYTELTENKSLS